VTAARAVLASSEQELTHLDNQLLLLIPALLAIPAEEAAGAPEAPISAFLEGRIEGIGGAGGGEEDDEGERSLQGNHFAFCRNGRRFVGLNSPIEIDEEPYRDAAPGILAVDGPAVVPWASTDSNPTASGGGCLDEEEYAREGKSEWLPAVAARASGLGWLWSSAASWRSPPLLARCSGWREEVKMQKGRQAPSWRKRQPAEEDAEAPQRRPSDAARFCAT
jgi:hypothetical protein